MAKKMIQNKETMGDKSPGIFQKIFYWGIIPLLFVIALLLVVATFTDINVFKKTEELFSFTQNQEEESGTNTDQIVQLQAEIKDKEAEIEQLKDELDQALTEKQSSQSKQEELQYEIEKLQQEKTESKKEYDEIVSTFEKMSAKKAAPIISEMSEEEALRILSNLKADTLSQVLSNMDPQEAAKYSELLAE